MTDFLDEKRHEITQRLTELKPVVAEYERLDAAARALEGVATTTIAEPKTPRRRRDSHRSAPAQASRRGRPKGSGTRNTQALEIVRAHPGIEIPEIASEMGIKPNYLYRVLPGLEAEGKVRKQGTGWWPV